MFGAVIKSGMAALLACSLLVPAVRADTLLVLE